GKDHFRIERDQLASMGSREADIRASPAPIDPQIAPFGPSQVLQGLAEGGNAGLLFRIAILSADQRADAAHAAVLLLPPRPQRPRRSRGAKEGNEIAPSHCQPRQVRKGLLPQGTI